MNEFNEWHCHLICAFLACSRSPGHLLRLTGFPIYLVQVELGSEVRVCHSSITPVLKFWFLFHSPIMTDESLGVFTKYIWGTDGSQALRGAQGDQVRKDPAAAPKGHSIWWLPRHVGDRPCAVGAAGPHSHKQLWPFKKRITQIKGIPWCQKARRSTSILCLI